MPVLTILSSIADHPAVPIDEDAFERLANFGTPLQPVPAKDVETLAATLRPELVIMVQSLRDDGTRVTEILSIYDFDAEANPTLRTMTRMLVGPPDLAGNRPSHRENFKS